MVSNIEDSTAAGQNKPKQNPKPKTNKKNPKPTRDCCKVIKHKSNLQSCSGSCFYSYVK